MCALAERALSLLGEPHPRENEASYGRLNSRNCLRSGLKTTAWSALRIASFLKKKFAKLVLSKIEGQKGN